MPKTFRGMVKPGRPDPGMARCLPPKRRFSPTKRSAASPPNPMVGGSGGALPTSCFPDTLTSFCVATDTIVTAPKRLGHSAALAATHILPATSYTFKGAIAFQYTPAKSSFFFPGDRVLSLSCADYTIIITRMVLFQLGLSRGCCFCFLMIGGSLSVPSCVSRRGTGLGVGAKRRRACRRH